MHACPALRPRRDLCAWPSRRVGAAFRLLDDVGSHDESDFGAQSHGLHARYLRFAAGVAPRPRKTRFRLVANLYRTGVATRWIPTRGFELSLHLILLAQAFPGAPNTRSVTLRAVHCDGEARRLGDRNDFSSGRRGDRSRYRRVLEQAEVSSALFVVLDVASKDPSRVSLSKHDDVVEALPCRAGLGPGSSIAFPVGTRR